MNDDRTIRVDDDTTVSASLCRPDDARALFVFAHGAGAGKDHAFMVAASAALEDAGIATLRYNFPYTEAGSRRPDRPDRLMATVRCAVDFAREAAPDLPLFAGGKSMGGRMTSMAQAAAPLADVRGLVFVGFPLHPAGKPGTKRADHLRDVAIPMLFLQGTRDKLAPLETLTPILDALTHATLHIVDGADHGFAVLKRSGRTSDDVLEEMATAIRAFAVA